MRDDRLPLFLNLLKIGEVKQRSRVMQVAAELGMQFVSKSRESLDTLAQALLSNVDEGCTLADLMEGGSLLAALLSEESNRKHKSLRQSSKVFVYIMESLGPAADQGREAPKRVVDFLVEFEKNHLASAAAAAAAVAAAAAAEAVKGNEMPDAAVLGLVRGAGAFAAVLPTFVLVCSAVYILHATSKDTQRASGNSFFVCVCVCGDSM
jgi:hypothetical protein